MPRSTRRGRSFSRKGSPRRSLQELGWRDALVSYRPFLSYNELGSMLDEGPSKLYDALSLVLGLEDLVNAQTALAESRLATTAGVRRSGSSIAKTLVEVLKALLAEEADDRASACLDALTSKSWGIDAVAAVAGAGDRSAGRPGHRRPDARRSAGMSAIPSGCLPPCAALRAADQKLKASRARDAETIAAAGHPARSRADVPCRRTETAIARCVEARARSPQGWAEGESCTKSTRLRDVAARKRPGAHGR